MRRLKDWVRTDSAIAAVIGFVIVVAVVLIAYVLIKGPAEKEKPKSRYTINQIEQTLGSNVQGQLGEKFRVSRTDCREEALNQYRCVVMFNRVRDNEGGYVYTRVIVNPRTGDGRLQILRPPALGGPAPRA